MPEIDLKPVFTAAGLAAIAAAHAQGLALKLTHVALGASGYPIRDVDGLPLDDARARTALADEQARVTLEAGGSIAPNQVLLAGTVEAGVPEFWIREVGFWSEEGILVALWSSDTTNLGWRGSLVPWVFRFVLAWQDLPADAIQVVYDGDAGMAALLLESNRLEATMRHTVQTAGLPRDPGDPSQLTLAIRAHVPAATTAVHGKTRLATAAEARAANLHDVAVTPAGVRQAVLALAGAVRRPKITAPGAGAVDVSVIPTIAGDAYYSLYGIAQAAAQVQVSTDAGFGAIVHDSGILGAVTSYAVPSAQLATGTTYHTRIRYRDGEGTWSEWSEPSSFSTGSTLSYIVRPAVTAPVDGATGVSLTPALASGAMSVANGADSHSASQWQVAAGTAGAADWNALVYDSGETGDLVAHLVPAGHLTQVLAAYSVRVRHRGAALGWSEWSTVASFTTAARPSTPVVTAPADQATGISTKPLLQSSAFAIQGTSDSHVASQWQVSPAADFSTIVHDSGETANLVSHQVPAAAGLQGLTTYFCRVRHKGLTTGWSEWSAVTSFTTVVVSSAVWTPKAGWQISNGGLTAYSSDANSGALLANAVVQGGKFYWEVVHNGSDEAAIGFLDSALGDGASWTSAFLWWPGLGKVTGASSSFITFGPVLASGVLMFAVDTVAQKAWLGANGTWQGGGNPVTGVSPTFAGAGIASVRPTLNDTSGSKFLSATARFSPGDWGYAAPTGFNPLP